MSRFSFKYIASRVITSLAIIGILAAVKMLVES